MYQNVSHLILLSAEVSALELSLWKRWLDTSCWAF